jgi:hypothetical protein
VVCGYDQMAQSLAFVRVMFARRMRCVDEMGWCVEGEFVLYIGHECAWAKLGLRSELLVTERESRE